MNRAIGPTLLRLRPSFMSSVGIAILPGTLLAAFWHLGETALVTAAIITPVLCAAYGAITRFSDDTSGSTDAQTGLCLRPAIVTALTDAQAEYAKTGKQTASLAISIEGLDDLEGEFGTQAANKALERVAERLGVALRNGDVVGRLGHASLAIALAPMHRADLETLLQISGRLQDAVKEPISIDATSVYLSCSIGFCISGRGSTVDGEAILASAETALHEAQQTGPGTIRSFSPDMKAHVAVDSDLSGEISHALETGQIVSWFQPQLCTDTGKVSGFEALARWRHPQRGLIPPDQFLGTIEQCGLSERLTEEILFNAFSALRSWDRAGLTVPSVGVNFSSAELRNPKLVDKIEWELDRFDLTPDRLTIEVLETVVAGASDGMVSRNIAALSALGCGVDLDDFGTGQASFASIRRFDIARLKIDRSFVARLDQDRAQQDMVAAILTMAERLNLATIAEGVETVGEHAMLSQLGCGHVQGFGIARPMPFEDTIAWIQKHGEKLAQTASLGRHTG
ncbi:putative bifunctional diguanylate cyclase/phosphodiesterase [Actibacterium lipolyticum]|uniref:Cyclic di-GMP phosphodiesterase Gmr n=1 Tax=Actibacterium lipolyticum TaxID=1524263 RepID=A0A238JK05_9RHOB|nr:bifunctional diguanylate cyclase/phosphodiesterase [Actibacterium lipolyticum]SMX31008.1 Cyclic di-GMP phosphodiesterase Gmr [Actibacterium lipolyticum]